MVVSQSTPKSKITLWITAPYLIIFKRKADESYFKAIKGNLLGLLYIYLLELLRGNFTVLLGGKKCHKKKCATVKKLLRRYVTAVDEYEGGLMLTLDSTHRVLRSQTVLTCIKETVQRDSANWKKAITNILVGCSVMTMYNKKLYRYTNDYNL